MLFADLEFLLKLLLSFLVGGIWVTATTIAAEHFGSKIGGWIGGLPSTAMIALLFIGLTQSPQAASQAAIIMPMILGIGGLFMVTFAILSKNGFWKSFFISAMVWFISVSIIVYFKIENLTVSLIGFLVFFTFSYIVLVKNQKIEAFPHTKMNYKPSQIIFRGIFAGTIISIAVIAGKVGGPILGGIFSAFPAVFTSTLFIVYFSHGLEYARAIAKSLTISGLISVTLFAVMVHYLYIDYGILLGTIISYGFSLLSAYLSYKILDKKI